MTEFQKNKQTQLEESAHARGLVKGLIIGMVCMGICWFLTHTAIVAALVNQVPVP